MSGNAWLLLNQLIVKINDPSEVRSGRSVFFGWPLYKLKYRSRRLWGEMNSVGGTAWNKMFA